MRQKRWEGTFDQCQDDTKYIKISNDTKKNHQQHQHATTSSSWDRKREKDEKVTIKTIFKCIFVVCVCYHLPHEPGGKKKKKTDKKKTNKLLTTLFPIRSLVIPRLVMSWVLLDKPTRTLTPNIPICLKPSLLPKNIQVAAERNRIEPSKYVNYEQTKKRLKKR